MYSKVVNLAQARKEILGKYKIWEKNTQLEPIQICQKDIDNAHDKDVEFCTKYFWKIALIEDITLRIVDQVPRYINVTSCRVFLQDARRRVLIVAGGSIYLRVVLNEPSGNSTQVVIMCYYRTKLEVRADVNGTCVSVLTFKV